MSYVAVNDIADLFFQIFGNGLIMALFVIGFLVVMMLIFRANIAVILIVIVPVILGFTLNSKLTNLIQIEPYIFPVAILVLFFVVGLFFKMSLSR